jgi:AcrR family transcriptional regulator
MVNNHLKQKMTKTPPDPEAVPARASRLPSAERQALILDAAVEEFAERGFAGARMAAVAGRAGVTKGIARADLTRAGVTKGLLYHYFPGGKLDLFRSAIAGCVNPLLEEAHRLADGFTGSRRSLLESLIDLGYGRQEMEAREHILMKLLLTEADRFPELSDLYRTAMLQPALDLARQVVEAGSAAGDFRPGAADEPGLAHVLLAPVLMGSIWRMMLGPEHAPSAAAMREAHLDLILRGLAP